MGAEMAKACRPCGRSDYTLEFARYFVHVSPQADNGDSLRITRKPATRTWTVKSPVDRIIAVPARHFIGLHEHFLILDVGCCPDGRGLIVFDLSTGMRVLDVPYQDYPLEPVLLGRRWLAYLEDLGETGPACPDAASWEENFGTGFEEEVWFDLMTLKVTRSGMIACSSRQ